jgi:hypothetical protein
LVKFKSRLEQPGPKQFRIKNSLLNLDVLNPRIDLVVAETYLIHIQPGQLLPEALQAKLTEIGRIKVMCSEAHYSYDHWPVGDYADPDILNRAIVME